MREWYLGTQLNDVIATKFAVDLQQKDVTDQDAG